MPLDPLAETYLETRRLAGDGPYDHLTLAEARALAKRISALVGPGEPVAAVEDRRIPGPGGDLPVRIYTPAAPGPLPVLVYFHGGGWVLGDLDSSDATCRALANRVPCLVVSVDYRLAPEHKFPAPVEDAVAATRWAVANTAAFNGDPARLAVGGLSAGATLAAVVTLAARDLNLRAQILTAPVADHAMDTASYAANADGYGLTRVKMEWFWRHYLAAPADGQHPHASPLRAPDLRGLPPAFVLTAEYDPLRDEGEAYAQRLRAAGVSVAHRRFAGMVHSFMGPEALPAIAQHLRAAFAGQPG